jgi:hypothetical protein
LSPLEYLQKYDLYEVVRYTGVPIRYNVLIKLKVKLTLEQATKAHRWGLRYSSLLSLTLALEGVGGHCHILAALPPGKQEAEWASVQAWTGAEILAPTRIRSLDPSLSP